MLGPAPIAHRYWGSRLLRGRDAGIGRRR